MRLYIIRHGKAERTAPTGRDRDRELTGRGVRQAEFLGRRLAACDGPERPGIILTSPFARAIATARLIQACLDCELLAREGLEAGRDAGGIVELIEESRREDAAAVLVGHNPALEDLLAALIHPGGPFTLRTGEMAAVDLPAERPIGGCRLVDMVRLED